MQRGPQIDPQELNLSRNLEQKGIYVRRHKFPSTAKAMVVLGRCGKSSYVDAASRRVREKSWSGIICYVGKVRFGDAQCG
jgi:hypothetical protein